MVAVEGYKIGEYLLFMGASFFLFTILAAIRYMIAQAPAKTIWVDGEWRTAEAKLWTVMVPIAGIIICAFLYRMPIRIGTVMLINGALLMAILYELWYATKGWLR